MKRKSLIIPLMTCIVTIVTSGCTPHVEVGLPEKPIEINITAKIDHDVRVRVEKDVENLINAEKGLF